MAVVYLPDWGEIIEEAFERCGLELRSGYDLRTARRSLNLLLLEWANRGYNLWTLEQLSLPLQPGVAAYALPNDTVDVIDGSIQTGTGTAQQFDVTISRRPVVVYQAIPNKLAQGRPVQFFIDRKPAAPQVTFWMVPDAAQPYVFVYWRLRLMQPVDSGKGTGIVDQPDMPSRMLPALIAGLAYYLSLKRAPDRIDMLKAAYEEAFGLGGGEDRERAGALLVPDVGWGW